MGTRVDAARVEGIMIAVCSEGLEEEKTTLLDGHTQFTTSSSSTIRILMSIRHPTTHLNNYMPLNLDELFADL